MNWRRRGFRWVQDEEGDIGVEIFGVVSFVKYKDSTIIIWFATYADAPKYVEIK